MLDDLYQEQILDHNNSPHNFGKLESANYKAYGSNPLCGDEIEVYLDIKSNLIKNIKFSGHGCAICKASASMMTEELFGKSIDESKSLFEDFHKLITTEKGRGLKLNKAAVFIGVKNFPMRVKCATLAWHTFKAALDNQEEAVKTE